MHTGKGDRISRMHESPNSLRYHNQCVKEFSAYECAAVLAGARAKDLSDVFAQWRRRRLPFRELGAGFSGSNNLYRFFYRCMAWYGLAVRTDLAVMLVPLLAKAERIQGSGSVHDQDAVQVINFVLQQFRHWPLRLEELLFATMVHVLHFDPKGPLHLYHQIG